MGYDYFHALVSVCRDYLELCGSLECNVVPADDSTLCLLCQTDTTGICCCFCLSNTGLAQGFEARKGVNRMWMLKEKIKSVPVSGRKTICDVIN